MRQDELLLTVLGIAILLNVLLVLASWLGSRRRRSRARAAQAPPGELAGLPAAGFTPAGREDDGRIAAAVEAFVASVSPDAAGLGHMPTADEVLARREEALRSAIASMPPVHLPSANPGPAYRGPGADTESGGPPPPARPMGVADAATWEEIVRDESARVARFRRASTVMTASLPRLEDVAERSGREAADRIVAEITRLLESEGRTVDRRAWLGDGKFGILLPETGADGASRYADRVRAAADAWLASAGLSVRLDLEWATLPNGADIDPSTPAGRPRKRPPTRPR